MDGQVQECRWSYFFYFRWANQMSTFFSDEQTRWALFFQMSKPDEHFFSDEQTRWALFFQMSKPDEHYSSDVQGEMSTFLSDEQVKMSTLYFQMSTFYLWDEHLSTLWPWGTIDHVPWIVNRKLWFVVSVSAHLCFPHMLPKREDK